MELQQIMVNIALGLIAFTFGLLIKIVWSAIKNLQKSCANLVTEVNALSVLIAGTYIKRDECVQKSSRIFDKLEEVLEKLGSKVDK